MWYRWVLEKIEDVVGQYSVFCKFRNIMDQGVWIYTSVYGPNLASERPTLWDELARIKSWWDALWVVGGWGGFNVVRFPTKKSCSTAFTSANA